MWGNKTTKYPVFQAMISAHSELGIHGKPLDGSEGWVLKGVWGRTNLISRVEGNGGLDEVVAVGMVRRQILDVFNIKVELAHNKLLTKNANF
jgi:hypothetical protein